MEGQTTNNKQPTTKKPAAAKKAAPKAESSASAKAAAGKKPASKPKNDSKEFVVFATGGKQYLVRAGQNLKIEKLTGEYKEGDSVSFKSVLLSGTDTDLKLGSPFISGGEVKATIKKIGRYKTIDVIKYKQKSRYFKKYGHRQPYFEVTIDSIK